MLSVVGGAGDIESYTMLYCAQLKELTVEVRLVMLVRMGGGGDYEDMSWKAADCSLVDNLIAKKLILLTFRPDAPVLLRARVKLSCGTNL